MTEKIKPEWKNVSSRRADENIFTMELPGIGNVTVHRHIDYPKDVWLLTMHPFFSKFGLEAKQIEEAQKEALRRVQLFFDEAADTIKDIRRKA